MHFKTAPSFFILDRGNNPAKAKWTFADKLLTLAVLQLESEKCPHCGVPAWHGQTADSRVEMAVEWHVCYGCQAKAEEEEQAKAKPGEWVSVRAVPEDPDEPEMPSRDEGYEKLAKPIHSTESAIDSDPARKVSGLGD